MRTLALLLFAALGAGVAAAQDTTPPSPAPGANALAVEAVLARSVVERQPQDTGSAFPADIGAVMLWTRVSGASGDVMHHVWFHGDEQVADIELQIGGSPWRTWSRKTIPPEATGTWRVEVRDATGDVLKSIEFTIG